LAGSFLENTFCAFGRDPAKIGAKGRHMAHSTRARNLPGTSQAQPLPPILAGSAGPTPRPTRHKPGTLAADPAKMRARERHVAHSTRRAISQVNVRAFLSAPILAGSFLEITRGPGGGPRAVLAQKFRPKWAPWAGTARKRCAIAVRRFTFQELLSLPFWPDLF
jgi:hypothetical protein